MFYWLVIRHSRLAKSRKDFGCGGGKPEKGIKLPDVNDWPKRSAITSSLLPFMNHTRQPLPKRKLLHWRQTAYRARRREALIGKLLDLHALLHTFGVGFPWIYWLELTFQSVCKYKPLLQTLPSTDTHQLKLAHCQSSFRNQCLDSGVVSPTIGQTGEPTLTISLFTEHVNDFCNTWILSVGVQHMDFEEAKNMITLILQNKSTYSKWFMLVKKLQLCLVQWWCALINTEGRYRLQ